MAVKLKPSPRQLQIDQMDVRRLDLNEYHRLVEIGFFEEEDERVELIEGVLHRMSPKGPSHAGVLSRILRLFITELGERAEVRAQDPVTDPHSASEPEPDLVLAAPREDNYVSRHPQPREVLLIVEIADTSLEADRSIKKQVYAAAGIEDYWIVNLVDNQIEVYREPMVFEDGTATYRQRMLYRAGDTVVPLQFPDCQIDVTALLP